MDQEPIPSTPVPAEPIIEPLAPPVRKFNPILILATIILLVLVGVGGIFLGKSLNNSPKSAQPTAFTVPTQIPIPTPDETANWQVYQNTKYNFEFKYPSGAAIKEDDNKLAKQFIVSIKNPDFVIDIQELQANMSENYLGAKPIGTIFGSIVWDILSSTGYCDAGSCGSPFIAYQTINGNYRYVILFIGSQAENSFQQRVLYTFKFLDQGETLLPTPDPKLAPYFDKLTVILTDKTSFANYYTSYWFWCAFSHDKRILPSSYTPYLQVIGTISSGETAYILSNTAPYPGNRGDNQHFIPSTKNGSDRYMTQADWELFLLNQQPDYPVIITKDSSGKLLMYIRQDYLFLPGC